jgi:hypothetical protein
MANMGTGILKLFINITYKKDRKQEVLTKHLTNPRNTDTIRTSISCRSVPGKRRPEFVRSADLQSPPHKWHGFRILTHNLEVVGSNAP